MLAALKHLFSPSQDTQKAHEIYVQIVAQARQPFFYNDWQVEDTIDGRFDIIVLHLFLMAVRFGDENPEFIRMLSETFFADMDRNLREMGVGDTGVGIRIKNMAQAFYGRLKVYGEAMDDEEKLAQALRHNVYRDKPVSEDAVKALAAYTKRYLQQLQDQSLGEPLQFLS